MRRLLAVLVVIGIALEVIPSVTGSDHPMFEKLQLAKMEATRGGGCYRLIEFDCPSIPPDECITCYFIGETCEPFPSGLMFFPLDMKYDIAYSTDSWGKDKVIIDPNTFCYFSEPCQVCILNGLGVLVCDNWINPAFYGWHSNHRLGGFVCPPAE